MSLGLSRGRARGVGLPLGRLSRLESLFAEPDDHLRQLGRGLVTAERRPLGEPVLNPSLALKELSEWLEDDRQWLQARGRHWVSLIDDLLRSCRALGPALSAYLTRKAGPALRDLSKCRNGLAAHDRQPPDVSLRRHLGRAQHALRDALGDGEALIAAWEDFVTSGAARERVDRAHALLDLAEATGHDRKVLSRSIRALLGDELLEVQRVRGDRLSIESVRERAGLSEAQRLELAAARLRQPPPRARLLCG